MLLEAGSGHTAGPLGMADVFTALYFHILKQDPKSPTWPERDRLILSNGHICPVLYAAMAHAGYFPVSELMTLRKFGSRLQGHPHREFLPMLETSSGPLGSGLSQAVGMALADRIDRGRKDNVMPLEPLREKWEAFRWHVQEINGHDFREIVGAVEAAKAVFEKPSVILADTIPGKGVKEFERDFHWHGKPPDKKQAEMALAELRTLGGRIRSEHE